MTDDLWADAERQWQRQAEHRNGQIELSSEESTYEWEWERDKAERKANLRLNQEAKQELLREQAEREYQGLPDDAHMPIDKRLGDAYEPPRETIQGWLGEGHRLIITGRWGLGKTTLAGELATTLAAGDDLFSEYATALDEVNIGHWNLEMAAGDLHALYQRLDPPRERIFAPTMHRVRFDGPEGADWIEWCWAYDIGLLIVDSLRRAAVPYVENINDNAQWARFYDVVDDFKEQAELKHIVFIAHPSKAVLDEVLGGSESMNWADAIWALQYADDKRHRKLTLKKGRNLSLPIDHTIKLAWDPETGRNSIVGAVPADGPSEDETARVLAALAEAGPEGLTQNETHTKTGIYKARLKRIFLDLEGSGRVEQQEVTRLRKGGRRVQTLVWVLTGNSIATGGS